MYRGLLLSPGISFIFSDCSYAAKPPGFLRCLGNQNPWMYFRAYTLYPPPPALFDCHLLLALEAYMLIRGILICSEAIDKEVGRQAVVPSALKSRGMSKAWTFSGPSQITVTLAELNRLENVNILKAPAFNGTSVSPVLRTVPGTSAQKWKNGWMDEHWAMENGRRRISGAIVLFWVVARGSQSADGEFTFGEDGPSPGPVSSMWT